MHTKYNLLKLLFREFLFISYTTRSLYIYIYKRFSYILLSNLLMSVGLPLSSLFLVYILSYPIPTFFLYSTLLKMFDLYLGILFLNTDWQ